MNGQAKGLSERNTFFIYDTDERGSGIKENLRLCSPMFAYVRLMGKKCLRRRRPIKTDGMLHRSFYPAGGGANYGRNLRWVALPRMAGKGGRAPAWRAYPPSRPNGSERYGCRVALAMFYSGRAALTLSDGVASCACRRARRVLNARSFFQSD